MSLQLSWTDREAKAIGQTEKLPKITTFAGVQPFLQHQAYMNDIQKKIYNIDLKLSDMRVRYKQGSPAMRLFLTSGAKLLKKELERLKKTGTEEKQDKLWK